jgi:hypothetical protein
MSPTWTPTPTTHSLSHPPLLLNTNTKRSTAPPRLDSLQPIRFPTNSTPSSSDRASPR